MSEFTNIRDDRAGIRYCLLASASALALISSSYAEDGAKAADDLSRPSVWIELGGQLERMDGGRELFVPSFVGSFDDDRFTSPLSAQNPSRYTYGAEGKLSFRPDGSDWTISAGIRYGRSNAHDSRVQQASPKIVLLHGSYNGPFTIPVTQQIPTHINSTGENTDRHAVVDFQAGKDVGLGIFGAKNQSTIAFGVRFAQFSSHSRAGLNGVPEYYFPTSIKYPRNHHRYLATAQIDRSFRGIGPSVAWSASAPLFRADEDASVTFDWGINAAVLFGKQKVRAHHQTTGIYYKTSLKYRGEFSRYQTSKDPEHSRSVTVPNIGGFASVTYRYSDAKLSLGYRADFFFGAMDGGIDTRRTYDRNFYGPYATISIGLGG